MDQTTITEGKTTAVISYITFIGLLVAYIMNNGKQNAFAQFHIGQSLRIVLLSIANSILGWLLPNGLGMITSIIGLGILVLVILGIVNAVNGEAKPLPIIGTLGE